MDHGDLMKGLVAIGTSGGIEILNMLGFEVIMVPETLTKDKARDITGRILTSRITIIEEEIYKALKNDLKQLLALSKKPPLLVVIPSPEKGETYRLEELYNMISRAVGVQLKWRR